MAGGLQRMNIGLPYGAFIADGQRFFTITNDAFDPVAVGPITATVPAPVPAATPMNSGPSATYERNVVGGPASGGRGGSTVNPMHVGVGLIVLLGASLLILHTVHFRE